MKAGEVSGARWRWELLCPHLGMSRWPRTTEAPRMRMPHRVGAPGRKLLWLVFFFFFFLLHVGMQEEEEEGGAFSSGDTFPISAVQG